MLKSGWLVTVILCVIGVQAGASPGFQGITADSTEKITKDLASIFGHRSISGAAGMGALVGFEAVLVVNNSTTPNISQVSEASGGGAVPNTSMVGTLLGVTIPFGITFEYLAMPRLSTSGITYSGSSASVRWLTNELIPVLPINMAVKFSSSNSEFSFEQNLAGINGRVTSLTGVNDVSVYFSPKLPIVEPYVGIGLVRAVGKLGYVGTGNIFDNSYTSSNNAEVTVNGTKTVAGVSIWLPFLSFGLEAVNQFGTTGYGAKFGINF